MSKIIEKYTKEARTEANITAVQNMMKLGIAADQILTMYSKEEYEEAVRRMDTLEAIGPK